MSPIPDHYQAGKRESRSNRVDNVVARMLSAQQIRPVSVIYYV